MLYVSETTAVVFSVGGQAGSEGPELIAAFEESPGNYVAVARVSRSVRIYNTTDNKALSVPRDAMLYAVHTPGEVSVINNTGKGYVLSSAICIHRCHAGRQQCQRHAIRRWRVLFL